MSFSGLTPESLIERSDSKNPATTCKGITTSGRPCRRGLASTPDQSPAPSPSRDSNGVVAVLDEGAAAAYFCWQHKDQAEQLVAKLEQQRRTKILPLAKKSSIDTLVERLGVVNLDEEVEKQPRHRISRPLGHSNVVRIKKRDTLPQEWQAMHGPLMSVPEEVVSSEIGEQQPQGPSSRPSARPNERLGRSNVKASWSCCIRADDDYNDDGPPSRRREGRKPHKTDHNRPIKEGRGGYAIPPHTSEPRKSEMRHRREYDGRRISIQTSPHQTKPNMVMSRPAPHPFVSSSTPPHSETTSFLSLIPPHLPPTTTSALLAELSKPISDADEAGYIYIFWLTPESEMSKPDDETASSLLDDDDLSEEDTSPTPSPLQNRSNFQQHRYRPSNLALSPDRYNKSASSSTTTAAAAALTRYASVSRSSAQPKRTILLKIGRAANVHRRLSQWTKQCGQNITLIRYYPYPSAMRSSGSAVPHVHRVERLIHLELATARVIGHGACVNCGREHREWFEVEATKEGVRAVDAVVRRWVAWAMTANPA